ncbi:MAG: hypothetical protein ABJY83_07255 [Roseibium sp.]
MTKALEQACLELDVLVEQKLSMWIEDVAVQRETNAITRVHADYLSKVTQLFQARSTLEKTVQTLLVQPQSEILGQTIEVIERGDFSLGSSSVNLTVQCSCLPMPAAKCSQAHDRQSERCSRGEDEGRGTVRDWNRSIIKEPCEDPEQSGQRSCAEIVGTSKSQTQAEGQDPADEPDSSAEIQDVTVVKTITVEDEFITDPVTGADAEIHMGKLQTERKITGDPRDGRKTKSTRSSRRGSTGNAKATESKP